LADRNPHTPCSTVPISAPIHARLSATSVPRGGHTQRMESGMGGRCTSE
jgi:hypothetical protein